MSSRPEQPEPFLHGCVFPAVTDAPYPRADPAGAEYLPADVWDAAQLPVGVRLELAGNARTIRVWYKTTRASLGYRGESAGCSFVAYRAGQKVAAVEAVMGEGMAELVISGRTDLPVTVYLPEGMQPLITGVAGVEETMVPAPPQPRWLAYGDAVTQGWLASAPAMAWPAVAGRKLGLDVCNLGYAGTARGESTSAVLLAETPAEVVSIAFGLNNWSRVPHTAGLMSEEVRCFLAIVRKGHPDVPIVVVSPTARPDAEDSPNRVGATLAELRLAMEEAVLDWIGDGDKKVYLVEGLSVVDPEDLEDGIYPGDEGHRRLAAAVAKVLVPHLSELQEAARIRWTRQRLSAPASAVSTAVEIPTEETNLVDGASLDAGLIGDAPVAPQSVDDGPFDEVAVSSNWWLDEPESLTGNVFDPTPPAGSSLELDSLEDEPENVAPRNLDLPDVGLLGRESLNNALLDALSANESAQSGAAVDAAAVDHAVAHDSFVDDPFVEDPYVDGSPVDDDRPVDSSFADYSLVDQYSFSLVDQYSFIDDGPVTEDVATVFPVPVPVPPALDDVPIQPVVVPTLEDTLAQAAAAPADPNQIADVTPVAVPPVPAPELDDPSLDAQRLDPSLEAGQLDTGRLGAVPVPPPIETAPIETSPGETAPVETALVETALVETALVETALVEPGVVAVPSPTSALNGEGPVSPTTNGTAPARAPSPPPAKAIRRETGPVDIAVADMVVAALTLATNGADDVIYGHEAAPSDELQWAEASDPGAF